MNDLLNKSLLIALLLGLNLPVIPQSTALSLYSYKDVVVVFPTFCKNHFFDLGLENHAIDTVNGIGVELDLRPFSSQFKIYSKERLYASFLPTYSCNSFDNKRYAFNAFAIGTMRDSQYIVVTTLNISTVELWHEEPLIQRVYPELLNYYYGIEISEDKFIAIVNIQYSSKCGRADFEGRSTQVNIYKLVSEIDLKSLIEWAEFLSKNVEFYPLICSEFHFNSLNYFPCEPSQ